MDVLGASSGVGLGVGLGEVLDFTGKASGASSLDRNVRGMNKLLGGTDSLLELCPWADSAPEAGFLCWVTDGAAGVGLLF